MATFELTHILSSYHYFIILSIHFETSYYIILLSLITIISEFWIKSSKKSIKDCEYNLLRLLYFDNYHKSYQRDEFKDIDSNIILENKFCKGISYFDIHSNNTQSSNENKRDTMVIIHGYYSGKIFAAPVIRTLSRYYDLIIPDLPGNGLSDKLSWFSWILYCKLFKKSHLQIEKYFVDILDDFFSEIGLNKFHLVSHSFGAYLAVRYVLNYPNRINGNLILLSPIGISNIDKPLNFNEYICTNKSIFGLYMRYAWCKFGSMQEITRCLGPCCSNKFVSWRLSAVQHTYYWSNIDKKYNSEIYKYWYKYTYNMYLSSPTSLFERLFYDFIGPYLYSYHDISIRFIDIILKYNINTLMCHGDDDWVSKSGAEYIYNEFIKRYEINNENNENMNVIFKVIDNCSHQIFMNQPVKVTNLIHQFVQHHV